LSPTISGGSFFGCPGGYGEDTFTLLTVKGGSLCGPRVYTAMYAWFLMSGTSITINYSVVLAQRSEFYLVLVFN